MNIKKTKFNTGFSLVETLVAIFILAMAVAAAMTVAQNSLQASFYARDRIAAFFLAQEAIELIKNRRDQNGLLGDRWLQGIVDWDNYGGPCGENQNQSCGIDVESNQTPDLCSRITDCILGKKIENGLIMHCPLSGEECGEVTGWGANFEEIIFSRKIKIQEISSNEARITVTVEWTRGLGSRKLEVVEHIFNWHPFSELE